MMKKTAALILSLVLILSCLSFSLAETAAEEAAVIPQNVAAESVQDFIGKWEMSGMIYSGTYFSFADMLANKIITEDSTRILTVTEDAAVLTYLGESMNFTAEMNPEDGTLVLTNDTSICILSLLDNGSLGMKEKSTDDSTQLVDITVVFSRNAAEGRE